MADWICDCKSDDVLVLGELVESALDELSPVMACRPLETSEFNSDESLDDAFCNWPLSDCESSCASPLLELVIPEMPDMTFTISVETVYRMAGDRGRNTMR